METYNKLSTLRNEVLNKMVKDREPSKGIVTGTGHFFEWVVLWKEGLSVEVTLDLNPG